jgi:hypothetical protein
MPRFYFQFSDGAHTFSDAVGVELVGFADVRNRVISQIRDIKGALSDRRIQDWTNWKMIVTDANQVTILEVAFDLKPKPFDETETAGLFSAQKRFR